MMITIQWKDGNEWKPFNLADINHMSRNHAINLFSNPPSVRAKQGDTRFTNRQTIKAQYEAKGQKCLLFSDLQPSALPLDEVGFCSQD
jgi:hypothetical protein